MVVILYLLVKRCDNKQRKDKTTGCPTGRLQEISHKYFITNTFNFQCIQKQYSDKGFNFLGPVNPCTQTACDFPTFGK